MLEGIAIIDKPKRITSHDVVDRVRRKFKIKKVGHAGTLDPLATGVLVLLIGKATKLSSKFIGFDKAYDATLILGTETSSADTEGKIIKQSSFDNITEQQVKDTFESFVGKIQQVPPMVSAVRHKGRKLYELARKGIEVQRAARDIEIYSLVLNKMNSPYVEFSLECSKGTYVRQLAEDVGKKLGCGACISQIRRTKVGEFKIEEAVSLEELNESSIRKF
ncbi:MAG: tRNA pseudouridine(55) synthase TruB [Candidatus Zapsychrus exili]|nr:tRNA pseudouridine(55) synthase TruB [Candidatus Zapsychrus exili]